ncbi:MAG TPA: RDD family protein [Steroidobacteraceae bacterium]|nr:RDD family protein [Steroidobacteraceae bacterium]
MSQETNPYAPPASNVSGAEIEPDRPIVAAGKGRRFGTFVVDYVCFLVVIFVLGVAAVIVAGDTALDGLDNGLDTLVASLLMALYYIFFEGIWGRTPGKFMFGTVVVNEQGGKASIGQVVGRSFCRFIPFEAFSCLGERGWHDSIPKTYVVMAR